MSHLFERVIEFTQDVVLIKDFALVAMLIVVMNLLSHVCWKLVEWHVLLHLFVLERQTQSRYSSVQIYSAKMHLMFCELFFCLLSELQANHIHLICYEKPLTIHCTKICINQLLNLTPPHNNLPTVFMKHWYAEWAVGAEQCILVLLWKMWWLTEAASYINTSARNLAQVTSQPGG